MQTNGNLPLSEILAVAEICAFGPPGKSVSLALRVLQGIFDHQNRLNIVMAA